MVAHPLLHVHHSYRLSFMTHNITINLTVRPVARLAELPLTRDSHGRAQGARPSRPAGYRERMRTS